MVAVEEKQDLISMLKQLAFSIKNEIRDSLSRGVIQPEERVYLRREIDKFQYTENGVADYAAHEKYFTKKLWFMASTKIEESIKVSNGYSSALELLTRISGKEDRTAHNLECFVRKLISQCLDNLKFDEADIDIFITTFLKDLNEEPVKYGAKVELDGIVVQPEIEFKVGDMNIILRQVKIEDLEKELPAYGFIHPYYLPQTPSAILNIEFLGRQVNEIQMKVGQQVDNNKMRPPLHKRWER